MPALRSGRVVVVRPLVVLPGLEVLSVRMVGVLVNA